MIFENITQINFKEQFQLNRLVKDFSEMYNPDVILIEGFKKEQYPKLLFWKEDILEENIDFNTIKFLYCDIVKYKDNKEIIEGFVEKYNVLFSTEIEKTILDILNYLIS